MASNPTTTEEDDDFVILDKRENINDSSISSVSTIPEKQTYESLEKLRESCSSLGDSNINELPYYESSQFIKQQLALEKKRGLLGEDDSNEKYNGNAEKDESGFRSITVEQCDSFEDELLPQSLIESQNAQNLQAIKPAEGQTDLSGQSDQKDQASQNGQTDQKDQSGQTSHFLPAEICAQIAQFSSTGQNKEAGQNGPSKSDENNDKDHRNQINEPGQADETPKRWVQTANQNESSMDQVVSLPNEQNIPAKEDPPFIRKRTQPAGEHRTNRDNQTEEMSPQPVEPVVLKNKNGTYRSPLLLVAIPVLLCSAVLYFGPDRPHPFKPLIEINTKTHVSPLVKSWELVATCKAYNNSYSIHYCQWKQIHPLPTFPQNSVLPGESHDCSPSTPSAHVDATLQNLVTPSELGIYTFELACGHDFKNIATKRVDILVNELIPPIMTVASYKMTVCTSIGHAKINVSCRAVQGEIVERKWEYIDGPPDIQVMPSQYGDIELSKPGIYKFKYRCTDSFGGSVLSSLITVTAKPPYVLGIDLGTSTTCISIIKEDGSRQDIGIHADENDSDPCMPSVVAFSLSGELLIGEKALQQAVVNPLSTIYEAKRLMGRSYYDDASHKFAYRVRPTLKSHSLKGVRVAVEIPCGKHRKKLVQPELVSALILRHVADHAQKKLKVAVKDVVISVPAQFDDAQRKATMDAGLIAGLNPIKIVNEPTVAAFAANSLTEKLQAASSQDSEVNVRKDWATVWAVVADIGGGTTDYALMQIQGSYYKVITTDGDKTLGGRDIDLQLAAVMTEQLQDKYPGLDLTTSVFKQKLRTECENAKIVLSQKKQYSLTVEYEDENTEKLPLEYFLTRSDFERHVDNILNNMVKPLDSLLARSGGLDRANIEELYLVGGTSNIPKLKKKLLSYFYEVKEENVRHKDPTQLVSRGAAAFGAALTGLIQVAKMPRIDAVPLPISIAVDMDDMHVIFERNRLYPCIEKRILTTYTNNQNAIIIKVFEGDGRTADECHFLGEFELSGIPPLPKNTPEIQATFEIDSNGILSVKASHGDMIKGMKLDVYSKSGGMNDKSREKMSLVLSQLMSSDPKNEAKCNVLEDALPMSVIPVKPRKSNVLKLSVDSEYDSVRMADSSDPSAMVPALGMVAVKGLVTDYKSAMRAADLDIVLVVDVSGSMTGVPIDTMKDVILHLIDSLEENHRLGIVTYAMSVNRKLELESCTDENKRLARDIVNAFQTMGPTNLYGGLLTGIQMAYHGGRRSRVLLFTDGMANEGKWIDNDDIIREIVRETIVLSSLTRAQVTLATFGYEGDHDEFLLQQLATNVGGGTYNFLNERTALGQAFGHVLGDAIHTVAEKIQLSITPLNNVQILEAITNFTEVREKDKLIFEIPSTADQQSRHVLLRLAVPPTKQETVHAGLYSVELTYTNTLTEREEGSEEYLFVARKEKLDVETRSHDVDEQLNRVFVARQLEHALEALKSESEDKTLECLEEAFRKVQNSVSKDRTLSVCLREDLESLLLEVQEGNVNMAKKSLQDSLTSHWQEKGGKASCYVTRKEDKLISILTSKQ